MHALGIAASLARESRSATMHVLQCSSYTNDQTQRSDSRLAPLHVAGLGDPVMDILVDVDPELLSTVADKAGGCIPIDTAEMSRLLDATTSSSAPLAYVLPHWPVQAAAAANLALTPVWLSTCPACSLPGGSAANVLKGLANLSAGRLECSFMGMVGKDATAAEYTSKLQQQGVTPRLVVSSLQCLLPHMVTAHQRGAAAAVGCNNIPGSRMPCLHTCSCCIWTRAMPLGTCVLCHVYTSAMEHGSSRPAWACPPALNQDTNVHVRCLHTALELILGCGAVHQCWTTYNSTDITRCGSPPS